MSLYRETRSRVAVRVGFGVAAAAILLVVGFALGRATAPSTSLDENLRSLRSDARVVVDALELVPLHYESSNATTRQGARDQLARASARFDDLEPKLRLLDPQRASAATRSIAQLERLVAEDAPSATVEAASTRARLAVNAASLLGGS